MAATRKKRKAVNTSPSTALVVFLVFFILLSMGLGVWGYYSNQSADTKEKKGVDLKAKSTKDDLLAQWYQMQALLVKSATGQRLNKAEVDEPNALIAAMGEVGGKFANMPNKADFDKMFAKFKMDLGWNDKEKVFPTNYVKVNDDLRARIKKLEDDLKRNDDDLKGLQGRENARDDEAKKALAKVDALVKKVTEDAVTATTAAIDKSKEASEAKKQALEALDKRIKEIEADYEKQVKKNGADLKERDAKIELLIARSAKLKGSDEEKTAKTDLLAYDVPKGKIIRIDWTGKMPYINLGRADGVKEQLTFSVFGRSHAVKELKDERNPKAAYWQYEKEVKASVEVVKVIDAHLSQARVTYMRDVSGDPLSPGDLVYNPAWNPNQKTHVAIAGLIDFTGEDSQTVIDQVRSLKEFMNNLERQNIIVDAYLNLRDNKVEGQITLKTDYFILAESPQFDGTKVADAKDEKLNSRSKVSDAIEAMKKDAIKKGVTVIPLTKFAIMTGYRLPRSTRSSLKDTATQDYNKPAADSGPKKVDEDKPKEEGPKRVGDEKPEMKDDKKDEEKDGKKEKANEKKKEEE
jgi:hypothetical protein